MIYNEKKNALRCIFLFTFEKNQFIFLLNYERTQMNKTEIKAAIEAENKRHEEVMKELNSKLRVLQMEEEARSRKSYNDRKELLNRTGQWLFENKIIRVGDIVKVTGSKAGNYREVVACWNWGIAGTVIGQYKVKTDKGIRLEWRKFASKVTEQGYNKITHIYIDNKFVPVKELMEQHS